MGILVSQLPSAELARLKAELAETLIANFCYPRFFDYRTNSLRMRPVDRAKRYEVWQYLSTVDFNAWGRIDLMSPDFQRQVERVFIHFVQRNRTFFGEQGRKRMADVRMLINTASSSVIEGLRGHLTGRQTNFGSPRPVTSWASSNITGHPEPGWDQIATGTMLLQQQLQEVREEIKATADVRPNGPLPRRSMRSRSIANGAGAVEPEVTPGQRLAMNKTALQGEGRSGSPLQKPRGTSPLPSDSPPSASVPVPVPAVPPVRKMEHVVVSEDLPQTPPVIARGRSGETAAAQVRSPEQVQPSATPPAKIQPRDLPRPTRAPVVGVSTKEPESTTVLVGDEDVVIFEQMRQQLIVWLRVEAIRAGLDISGQGPAQLLELLRQQHGFDETRLQVVSTLLNLSNQIIATGHAGLLEYKQAIMFYLMHTRRAS